MMTSAIERLRSKTADAWKPRPRLAPDEWIERHVFLNEEYEATRGPYDLMDHPWWRPVLRAAGNPNTRYLRLRCSTQVGKTLLLCSLICYLAKNAPASAMAVLPDRDSATEFRDRLYALAASSGIEIPPGWRWNTRHCDVGDMRVYLAWPRSRQRLRGRRCKYVFRSEIDVYQETHRVGNPIEASNRRVKAFKRFLILDESTPIPDTSRIEDLEKNSNRLRWWAKCPHCGEYQVVRFFVHKEGPLAGRGGVAGMRSDQGHLLSPAEARVKAHYVCVSGCVITNDQKPRFVKSGVACADGQTVDREGNVRGTAMRDERDIGLHLWSAHSHDSWGDLAAEYVTAVNNGTLPDFFQNVLGMSYKQQSKMPTWQQLGMRLGGWHARGSVPRDAWFLTAGGDVQDREVYVTVRAWGDQRTSWLVDWFVFERSSDDDGLLVKSDLAQITAAVLQRSFPVVGPDGRPAWNPRGRELLRVLRLGIDANHRTLDVHNWIKSLGELPRVIAVRGEMGIKPTEKYKDTLVHESKRAAKDGQHVQYEGGLQLMHINPDVFRSDLADRFTSSPDKPGAWFVTSDCLQAGEFYLKQVVNEPKIVTRGKDGRPKVEWKERDQTIGHDFWDCEVYSSAIAQRIVDEMDGQPGWDAARWPRPALSKQSQATGAELSPIARDFS